MRSTARFLDTSGEPAFPIPSTKRFSKEEAKLVLNMKWGTNIHISVEIASGKKPKERNIGKKGKTKPQTNNS